IAKAGDDPIKLRATKISANSFIRRAKSLLAPETVKHLTTVQLPGISAEKPIHELRKEFGSMVNRKHGLTAAKDLLRHGDIATTAAHYIDAARKATSGIGPLLVTKRKGRKIVQFKYGDTGSSPSPPRRHQLKGGQLHE